MARSLHLSLERWEPLSANATRSAARVYDQLPTMSVSDDGAVCGAAAEGTNAPAAASGTRVRLAAQCHGGFSTGTILDLRSTILDLIRGRGTLLRWLAAVVISNCAK